MAKKEGKPVTHQKLPDPKERKKCKHEGCNKDALYTEDFCWQHLDGMEQTLYKSKISKWVNEGVNLERANLQGVDFHGVFLQSESSLQGVDLRDADLENAQLLRVKLRNAELSFANLKGANLWEADLRDTFLVGAELKGTDLTGADLSGSDLKTADLEDAQLYRANLQRTKLELARFKNTYLMNVDFKNAWLARVGVLDLPEDLIWERVDIIGDEQAKDWTWAKNCYIKVKNHFHQQGRYQDESKAYYREKLMAKHEEYEQCFKKKQPKHFLTWFGLWLLWAVAGFGERWMRIIPWVAGILLFFTGLFFLGSNLGWGAPYDHPTLLSIGNLFDCFVFSVVTFVTLGFGAIWTQAWLAKALIILEAALGFVFLGMFVVLIARKFGR
jgi:hypothetical protein